MRGNLPVRFLGGREAAMPPCYPTDRRRELRRGQRVCCRRFCDTQKTEPRRGTRIAMEEKSVSGAVWESLAPLLVPKGFKRDRKWGYRRVLPEVRQTVGLWTVNYYLESKFSLTFFFRVEAAEAILQQ